MKLQSQLFFSRENAVTLTHVSWARRVVIDQSDVPAGMVMLRMAEARHAGELVHLVGMRYVCLLMALVFGLFTFWQFNDLDQYHTEKWYLWVAAYGLCALISAASFFKRLPVIVYISVIVAAVTAAVVRIQAVEWSREILYNPDNPSGNETGGLLVVAIWMAVLAWSRRAPARKHAEL